MPNLATCMHYVKNVAIIEMRHEAGSDLISRVAQQGAAGHKPIHDHQAEANTPAHLSQRHPRCIPPHTH
eukprot:365020-Amphidinium_carterae.2